MMEDSIGIAKYTPPMQDLIQQAANSDSPAFFVCNTHPRLVDGKPTKNPRYLQVRPDLVNPRDTYLAIMGARMHRRIPLTEPVHSPVNAVLSGRRNNPPDAKNGIRSLAVYNPIHYMELPELFMEFICSMTGKSPSTTGAGSEGALTKGPFNALPTIIDLNNTLVSYLLTGYCGYVTSAGYIGPHARVDHDVSMLIPEIWCRMLPHEQSSEYLLENGYLEKCEDREFEGKPVLSSRLGYRINRAFVRTFFGRVFNHPHVVFTDEMLKPEEQDQAIFADGMDNIVETQRRVAKLYFEDGSIAMASPPLKALLHIMAENDYEGKDLQHPDIRKMFTREYLLASDWYQERLKTKQNLDINLWEKHIEYLEKFLTKANYLEEAKRIGIPERLVVAQQSLKDIKAPEYLEKLKGSIGAQPL
jgi:hypothetical protein